LAGLLRSSAALGVTDAPTAASSPATRPSRLRRIGHKGADAIVPGNTIESFQAAVDAGVDMIELDVVRPRGDFADGADWRKAAAGPGRASGPLLVAHDWADAERRTPLTLPEALDAFTRPPLERVEIDCDLKLAGREDEVVAALRERDLIGRSMVSTMEIPSLAELRDLERSLRRGWTFPRITRAWDRKRWARPMVAAWLVTMRRRLPALAAPKLPILGVAAMWIYDPLATPRLASVCDAAGVELIAWTVDDPARITALEAMGVHGICTNDPRLLDTPARTR
jgi:glycerophosphoryl diester phosphodiesterase